MKMLEPALETEDLCISKANCLFFMYLLPVSSRMFSRSSISSGSSSFGSGFSGVELAVVSSLFWAPFLFYDLLYYFVGGSCFFCLDYCFAILRMYLSESASMSDRMDLIDSISASFLLLLLGKTCLGVNFLSSARLVCLVFIFKIFCFSIFGRAFGRAFGQTSGRTSGRRPCRQRCKKKTRAVCGAAAPRLNPSRGALPPQPKSKKYENLKLCTGLLD